MFPFKDFHKEVDRETKKFVVDFIEPQANERNKLGIIPNEIITMLAKTNMISLLLDVDAGGAGLDLISACIVIADLAYSDASVAHLVETTNFGFLLPLLQFGTEEQRGKILNEITLEGEIATIAFTEPEKSMVTIAEEVEDGYILNGIKTMITCANAAKYALVHAKFKEDTAIFIVELKKAEGITIIHSDETMGLNSLELSDIYFHNVKLSSTALLGENIAGLDVIGCSMTAMRISNAALALGLSKRALDEAVEFCKIRKMNEGKLFDMQIINYSLAELKAEIECMESIVFSAASMYADKSTNQMLYSSSCKLIVTEKATRVCDRSLQFFGGYGYMRGMNIERIYRDVRALTIIGGISDMLKWSVSRFL